ncbi:hypothetical protein, partial [Porphyromonas gingivalis]|uniref:hypothetical protein n=1 Tax=Porphyromonas gingivalis TaxID=837 RepID=UPI00117E001D
LDMQVDGLIFSAFMPKDSIGSMQAVLHAEGRGFDLFNKRTVSSSLQLQIVLMSGRKIDT